MSTLDAKSRKVKKLTEDDSCKLGWNIAILSTGEKPPFNGIVSYNGTYRRPIPLLKGRENIITRDKISR